MKQYEKFKRVVPLVLAIIILAGTVFSLFASIAGAEESDGENVSNKSLVTIAFPRFYDPETDDEVSYPEVGVTYNMRVTITMKEAGYSRDDIQKVYLEAYDTFLTEDTELKWDDDLASGGTKLPVYSYQIKGVRWRTSKETRAEIRVMYQDGTYTPRGFNVPTESRSYDDSTTNDKTSSSSSNTEVITTPKMLITGFEAPDIVNPEEEFQVSVTFLNNSKVKSMENVTMTLTPPEGASILNGTNKRYYISIPRRQSSTETFTIKTSKNLKLESLNFTFKFEYQYKLDGVFKDGTSEETLSIASIPKEESSSSSDPDDEGAISAFEILSVVPPDSMFPDEEGYVTVKVINKDHEYDAANVQLTVTGEGLINNGNTEYHGALAHSSQAEIEMPISFKEPGTYQLEAIVVYEDSEGKDDKGKPKVRINDVKRTFTVTVQEAPQQPGMDGMGGMGMGMDGMGGANMGGMANADGVMLDENGMPVGGGEVQAGGWLGLPVWAWWAIGGGGAVIVTVIILLVVRRVKKKKAEDEDEAV